MTLARGTLLVTAAVLGIAGQLSADCGGSSAPTLYNYSGSSDANCWRMVGEATSALGLPAGQNVTGGDYMFCGRYYLAWIDNTGFYGELNGLWRLNGQFGEALDFVYGSDGRPRNVLIVAENNDGQWAPGYSGGSHLEVLSHTPEPGDEGTCDPFPGRQCNGFAFNEAGSFTDPDIPWWTACNPGSPSFSVLNPPYKNIDLFGTGRKFVHRVELTKESDNDGNFDGDSCHAPWLFPDGVRRHLYLQTGWELYGGKPELIQTWQVENPNSVQAGGHGYIITSLTLTALPGNPSGKGFRTYAMPETATVHDDCNNIDVYQGVFNYTGWPTCPGGDRSWGFSQWTVSTVAGVEAGRTLRLWDDTSIQGQSQPCDCFVHGGFELVGGTASDELATLTNGIGPEHRLHFELPGNIRKIGTVYEAETALSHQIGRAVPRGWSASPGLDPQGYMVYGPYATNFGGGLVSAIFRLKVGTVGASDTTPVVRVDVNDHTNGDQVLGSYELSRSNFQYPGVYTEFPLTLDLTGHEGHQMETRVFFYDTTDVTVDRVRVRSVFRKTYYAERPPMQHQSGRLDKGAWSASVGLDPPNTYMMYGPYATTWGGDLSEAIFRLMVDDVTADNVVVATIDVNDSTTNEVLVSRPIRRRELTRAFGYKLFRLTFDLTGRAGHAMEARVFWPGTSYVRVNDVLILTK